MPIMSPSISRERPKELDTVGTCPTPTTGTIVATECGVGVVRTTVITVTGLSITMTDEAGVVAYGGQKIYDFPEGLLYIFGGVTDLAVTKSGAGINADFDGDVGVGTVTASNNNSLATTEQNIIPTTATPQAVSGVTTADAVTASATGFIDGTATAADAYLNFLIDDADQNGGGALLVTGTITITWMLCGDK